MDDVIDGLALIFFVVGLVEVDEHISLAIPASVDLGVGDVGTKDGIGDRARS